MGLSSAHRLATQLGGVLPRSLAALHRSQDWSPLSGRGVRQVAEVALDELVVTGLTLMSSPPRLDRPVEDYAGVAAELAALGVAGVHRAPEPLEVRNIRPISAGVLSYERMSYDHDPQLVSALAAEGHDGIGAGEAGLAQAVPARGGGGDGLGLLAVGDDDLGEAVRRGEGFAHGSGQLAERVGDDERHPARTRAQQPEEALGDTVADHDVVRARATDVQDRVAHRPTRASIASATSSADRSSVSTVCVATDS